MLGNGNRKEAIKIAVIGSLDSGKSTLIASILNVMTYGLQGVLSVLDYTDYRENVYNYLNLRIADLLDKIDKSPFVMQISERTPNINQYDLRVSFPNPSKRFAIKLIDIPGSMLYCSSLNYEHIVKILQDCDTIVVAVDTPYLMHEKKVVRQLGNNLQDVFYILTKVLPSTDRDMQIIFAPLKCEKWMHHGAISEVVNAVSEEYSSAIPMLSAYPNVGVSIISAETIGAVEFYEFRQDYVLYGGRNSSMKQCSPIPDNNKLVALYNGEVVEVQENEELIKNINAIFPFQFGGSKIERLVGWYEKSKNINNYHPQNCDQIVLHSIRFVFDSILRKNQKCPFWNFFPSSLIGNLSAEDMRIVLDGIKCFIKDDVEGIVTIKSINQ